MLKCTTPLPHIPLSDNNVIAEYKSEMYNSTTIGQFGAYRVPQTTFHVLKLDTAAITPPYGRGGSFSMRDPPPISIIVVLKDLEEVNEAESTCPRSQRTNAYFKCIQRRPKHCIPNHGELHRSLELTLNPDSFIRDPSKIITHISDQVFNRQGGDRWAGEVESDGR